MNKNINIPTNIIKQYIVEELRNRRNALMRAACEDTIECVKENGIVTETISERGWYASGIGTLADDVEDGNLTIKEGIDSLTKLEKQNVYNKCLEWYKNNQMEIERE